MTNKAVKRLIIGPSWVGDMVMAQTLFRFLQELYPDDLIDVLAPAWSQAILARMPEVNRAIDMPIGHGVLGIGERRKLAKALISDQYQQAIVLPNSWKSALVPFWASIPTRTGWRGEMRYGLLNDLRRLDKPRYPLMIQRFAALALKAEQALPEHLPEPRLVINPQQRSEVRERLNLVSDKPILALCPGAEFGLAKQWPIAHYAKVAEYALAQHWQVWIMGSENDAVVAESIAQHAGGSADIHCLAGKTRLAEAVDLLSAAQQVVSNDSGLMHIAAALQRPLVVMYGSTSADFTPPLSATAQKLSTSIDCRPCFKRECPFGHYRCLTELSAQQVINVLQQLPVAKELLSVEKESGNGN